MIWDGIQIWIQIVDKVYENNLHDDIIAVCIFEFFAIHILIFNHLYVF